MLFGEKNYTCFRSADLLPHVHNRYKVSNPLDNLKKWLNSVAEIEIHLKLLPTAEDHTLLWEFRVVSLVKCRGKKHLKKSVQRSKFLSRNGKEKGNCTDDVGCSTLCVMQSSQQDTVCIDCYNVFTPISISVVHSARYGVAPANSFNWTYTDCSNKMLLLHWLCIPVMSALGHKRS